VLPSLSLHQIVFFDKCHNKYEIGRTGEKVYAFTLDENGLYSKEGEVAKVETKLHINYEKEGRFSFGVAAVEMPSGSVIGRRCKTFD
jgi:hypothetical protein